MKLNKILLAALAAVSFSACSDSTDVNDGKSAQWNQNGEGYISLSLNLPTQKLGTRADNNKFDDGDKNEYAVNNAYLLLFNDESSNPSEANARFAGVYKLDLKMNLSGTSTDAITSVGKITQKINETKGQIYALVILNSDGVYNDENKRFGNLTLTEGPNGTTLHDLQNTISTFPASTFKSNGFFMTNAPLANVGSSTNAVPNATTTTLAKVTGKVYPSEAEANSNDPAATIYVERNLAKVTLNDASADHKFNTGSKEIDYTIKSWTLDNTNKKSYIVRNVDDWRNWTNLRSQATAVQNMSTGYRFQNSDAIATGLYRTYFGKDPNYDTFDAATDFETVKTVNESTTEPLYCLENTFNVDHQNQNETTRAILEVQYGNGQENYFAYGKDTRTLQDQTNFLANATSVAKEMGEVNALGLDKSKVTVEFKQDASNQIENNNGEAKLVVKYDGTENTDLTTALNQRMPNINYYQKGIAYYSVLIKHFGDELTPWNGEENTTMQEWQTGAKPNSSTIYPTDHKDANYLGRYGVLRNNWYDLSVKNILKIGSPKIPTSKTTTDDEIDNYIRVEINVLPWAVRKNDITLQ